MIAISFSYYDFFNNNLATLTASTVHIIQYNIYASTMTDMLHNYKGIDRSA